MTEYQFTNVRHGKTVWFIWANFADGPNTERGDIYRHLAQSLRFEKTSPKSLTATYGKDFLALDLPIGSTDSAGVAAPELATAWWSPFVTSSPYTVNCGSPAHVNGALYAADISAVVGRNVYAANNGVIEFWGWDTSGYGNLVKINKTSNGYRHYYGHLNEINFAQSTTISRAAYLGKSGDSGGVPAHLHFHVQNGSNQNTATGISLVGMTGFTSNSNYPSTFGVCGSMGRAS